MKKILIVAATAGLMTLAACQPTATNNTTTVVDNTAVEANAAEYNDTTVVDNAMPAMDNTAEMANTTADNATH